jgi:signal transduction histidine kinase
MSEMRTLLTLIRQDDLEDPTAVGTRALTPLVDRTRNAGIELEVRERGERGELPQIVDVSLYRIAQESLTNVIKHSPVRAATMEITYAVTDVSLRVSSPSPQPPSAAGPDHGFGLLGMGERVAVLAGTFDAGWRDGQFVVEATLPRSVVPADSS